MVESSDQLLKNRENDKSEAELAKAEIIATVTGTINEKTGEKKWVPIESNPEVFTNYAEALGFPTYAFSFHDVYSLDEEQWTVFIPQPVLAVVFCFEIKKEAKELID